MAIREDVAMYLKTLYPSKTLDRVREAMKISSEEFHLNSSQVLSQDTQIPSDIVFQAEYSKKHDTWEKFDEEQRFFF